MRKIPIPAQLVLTRESQYQKLLKLYNPEHYPICAKVFFVVNDKVYWKKMFLKNTQHHTLWLDYSQNIAFKEKRQVQSAHFSGKQQTLHNTIIQTPGEMVTLSIYITLLMTLTMTVS